MLKFSDFFCLLIQRYSREDSRLSPCLRDYLRADKTQAERQGKKMDGSVLDEWLYDQMKYM
jgi:hypothetical protein